MDDVRIANVEVRPLERDILVDGRRLGLSVREFEVFMVLFEHFDRVVLRSEIYRLVWRGPMSALDRSVDSFIFKIRTKLAAVAPGHRFIHTHFGTGYRFAPEPEPPDRGLQPS